MRTEHSIRQFKTSLHAYIGITPPRFFFNVGSKIGNMLHTRIRLRASDLHEDQHKFGKNNTTACRCGGAKENVEHFLLVCPLFNVERTTLYDNLSAVLGNNFRNIPREAQIEILTKGPSKTNRDSETNVALAVQRFILQTKRFSH